jgi:GTP pyrophosphokinase
LNFATVSKTDKMDEVVASLGVKNLDDLIANVGYGKVTPLQVLRPFTAKPVSPDSRESLLEKLMSRVRKKRTRAGVLVKGLEDILIKFGKCCQPVPGDPIIGYITQGYGVTVHRASCVNALRSSPERQIDVEWSTDSAESYPVKIQIVSYDRMGLLADLVGSISKLGANILNASSDTKENKTVESHFTISVADTGQLEKILAAVRTVKQVQYAKRIG